MGGIGMSSISILALLATLVFGPLVSALPLPAPGTMNIELPSTFTTDYNFEGIVALSNCSGSLVRLENAKDTDSALILTNGHCLGSFMRPGQYKVHEASSRAFRLYNARGEDVARVQATEILYATMTGTDMAIYQLRETYAQILSSYNVRPFMLSSVAPAIGQPIEVISGYWERGYSCAVEAQVHELHEDDWVWKHSLRYSRPGCETIGGTSGSPVVAAGTRTVVGVNNTGNENGDRCTMNNPCEVDENGNVSYTEGFSYGQQVFWLYSCLNENNELDLAKPDCQLHH